MKEILSPSEKARQILHSIEMEEKQKKRKKGKPTEEKAESKIKPVTAAKEEIEESPIYSEEIGSNSSLLKFDQQSILQGIIFSEILGKPAAKRKGR